VRRRASLLAGALPLAAALAAYPPLEAGTPSLAALGGVALLLYVLAALGLWPGAVAAAVLLLAIEYGVSLELGGGRLDLAAPAYGAILLVCAELGWVAAEGDVGGGWSARRSAVAGVALASAALGWAVLVVSALPLEAGLTETLVGVAAALAAVTALAWLARVAPGGAGRGPGPRGRS
jgi:hypothetical protein